MSDIELTEPLQRMDSFCTPDYYSKLLSYVEDKNSKKFEELLRTNIKVIDINNWYGDPHYGTILDICCRSPNNYRFIQILLAYGAKPNEINKIHKKGPIHFAVEHADYVTVETLLEDSQTDINLLDKTGNTALHIAAKLNKIAILNLLLKDSHVNVNQMNRKGQTALHVAITQNNKEAVNSLLKRTDIDLDEIKSANDKTCRQLIMEKFPDLEIKSTNNKPKINNVNNLFYCLYQRDTDTFLKKISEESNLNNNDGSHTYLQYACDFGLRDVAQYLLDYGVNPNEYCPSNNKTPIMIAAYRGYVNIVRSFVQKPTTSYEPINGETVLHSVINGISYSDLALASSDEERNYYEVLRCLLSEIEEDKININQGDLKGNTVLHYAAKLGDEKIILVLLQHGAYIGKRNILGDPALTNIPFRIFEKYLNQCITTNDKLPREDNYEIIFKYNFLVPPNRLVPVYGKKNSQVSIETEDNLQRELPHAECETRPLLYISELPELRPLLKHPVFTSFINLKWYSIRKYFYLNLTFYLSFWIFLTYYILGIYSQTFNPSSGSFNETSNEHPGKSSNLDFSVWIVMLILLMTFALRELFQFVVAPWKYVSDFENWIEIVLIVITSLILLCQSSCINVKHQLSATAILLSWTELVLLIGRHPLLSTNIEMFKTVTGNFLKFLSWYSIFILAFSLSFYMLFKDESSSEENFFRDPAMSTFKSVVMLTGEFDVGSIPFQSHPGTSHILFVLFVFLIAIVLFNLLNGLAVSDTQNIKANAELVSYISRIKLVSYFESMMSNRKIPSEKTIRSGLRCCCLPVRPVSYKHRRSTNVRNLINLFPYLLYNGELHVLPNQECKVIITNKNKPHDTSFLDDFTAWYIDPSTIKCAKRIINNKTNLGNESSAIDEKMLNDYKSQLNDCKRELQSMKKNCEQTRQMVTEILSLLHNGYK